MRKSFVAGLALALAAAAAWAATTMSVQVREGQVRATPSFLGEIIATVGYGHQLQVVSQTDGWAEVTVPSSFASGYIHESTLTDEDLELEAGDQTAATGASGEELALAGKGFNQQVEAEFRRQNPDLDYGTVDRMEETTVSPQQVHSFLTMGGLHLPEGR